MKFKSIIQTSLFCIYLSITNLAFSASGKSHDEITPIPQNAEPMQTTYLPRLSISTACYPYTAVDQLGNWNNGLKDSGSASGSCSSTSFQQVYTRYKSIGNDTFAIMYAYYFPKDNGTPFASIGHRHDWEHIVVFVKDYNSNTETIVGAAYSAHGDVSVSTSPNKSNTHIYIHYGYNGSFTHSFVEGSSGTQSGHVLIDYNALSSEAKNTLNTHSFGSAVVPFKESNFNANIDEAMNALGL